MEIISKSPVPAAGAAPRPWDARLGRRLVTPLKDSWVTPNHLTTVRLAVGLAGALAFTPGTWGWTNLAALLVILSNFLDHTDGELARISGKTSRIGHLYDLASDALVTILLFVASASGWRPAAHGPCRSALPAALLGALAGTAVALIFYLRMRIEELLGKAGTRQASLGGFETEDVLYLLPLVTLFGGLGTFLLAARSARRCSRCLWSWTHPGVARRGRRRSGRRADRAAANGGATPASMRDAGAAWAGSMRKRCAVSTGEQGSFLYVPGFLPAGVHRETDRGRGCRHAGGESQFPARPQAGRQRQSSQH